MMDKKYFRRAIFKVLKKSDLIYSLNYRIFLRKELKFNSHQMRLQKIKNLSEVRNEIKQCRRYWHCYVRDYYLYYELYNKQIGINEVLDYVPPFFFANYHQEFYQKGLDIVKLSNKFEQYRLLTSRQVRTPQIVCIIQDGRFYDIKQKQLNLCDFEDYEKKQKLFVKPVDSMGGYGIVVMDSFAELDSKVLDLKSSMTYIVQRGIIQRSDFSRINPSSVNTLRVIVHEDEQRERMVIKICILRMGRNNAVVDNSAQGGLSIGVNVMDGTFADFATTEHGGGKYQAHPDTGFVFKGNKIEGWNLIKKQVEEYASRLIDFRDVALDVAVLNDGVCIIEYNFGYGIDHIQKTMGGVAKIFNINPSCKND